MAVFASMRRSGVNAYPGWLTITNQLFAAGQQELAEQCVLDRQPDWQPDADVYEHIIKSICSGCQEKPAVYTAAGSVDAEPAADSEQTVSDHFLEASNILAEMKVLLKASEAAFMGFGVSAHALQALHRALIQSSASNYAVYSCEHKPICTLVGHHAVSIYCN